MSCGLRMTALSLSSNIAMPHIERCCAGGEGNRLPLISGSPTSASGQERTHAPQKTFIKKATFPDRSDEALISVQSVII